MDVPSLIRRYRTLKYIEEWAKNERIKMDNALKEMLRR